MLYYLIYNYKILYFNIILPIYTRMYNSIITNFTNYTINLVINENNVIQNEYKISY